MTTTPSSTSSTSIGTSPSAAPGSRPTARRGRRGVRHPRALITALPNTAGAQTPPEESVTGGAGGGGDTKTGPAGKGAARDVLHDDTGLADELDDTDLADLDPTDADAVVAAAMLRELADQTFLDKLTERARLAETGGIYHAEVANFTEWMALTYPDLVLVDATAKHITSYRDHLFGLGLAQSTVRVSLFALRAFYEIARELKRTEGIDLPNPTLEVPLPPHGPVTVCPYTPAEARRILTTIRCAMEDAKARGDRVAWFYAARDFAMLATAFFAGLRRGEIRRLRGKDLLLDLPTPQIDVRGKGDSPDTITIPHILADIWHVYLAEVRGPLDDHDFLFAHLDTSDGQVAWVNAGLASEENRLATATLVHRVRREEKYGYGIGPYTLTAAAQRWGLRAGVDGPHGPHRWRHTHASACAETGMPMRCIGERLGHSMDNLNDRNGWEISTVRYVHVSDEYLAHVVDRALPAPVADEVVLPPLPGASSPDQTATAWTCVPDRGADSTR